MTQEQAEALQVLFGRNAKGNQTTTVEPLQGALAGTFCLADHHRTCYYTNVRSALEQLLEEHTESVDG